MLNIGVLLSECVYLFLATAFLFLSVGFYRSMDLNTASMTQIDKDWKKVPYVDILSVKASYGCP